MEYDNLSPDSGSELAQGARGPDASDGAEEHYRILVSPDHYEYALHSTRGRGTKRAPSRATFSCPISTCRLMYRRRGDLKVHVQLKHSDVPELAQRICKASSAANGTRATRAHSHTARVAICDVATSCGI